MTKALRKTEALLREMVAVTLRTDLTRNQRTNLETCITVHMHQKVGPVPQPPVSGSAFCATLKVSMRPEVPLSSTPIPAGVSDGAAGSP